MDLCVSMDECVDSCVVCLCVCVYWYVFCVRLGVFVCVFVGVCLCIYFV